MLDEAAEGDFYQRLRDGYTNSAIGLKPGADVYRDVVASGGQLDVGFIPLWLGLVTMTSLIPPAVTTSDPQSAIGALASHIGAVGTFTGPTLVKAMAGQDTAYDGPFYAERSPINVISKVTVPTFLVGGAAVVRARTAPAGRAGSAWPTSSTLTYVGKLCIQPIRLAPARMSSWRTR
mgnify:CR=1 FL=1